MKNLLANATINIQIDREFGSRNNFRFLKIINIFKWFMELLKQTMFQAIK